MWHSSLFLYTRFTGLYTGRNLTGNKISITEEDDCQRSLGLYGDWANFPAADCSQTGMAGGSCRMPDWSWINIPGNTRSSLKSWSIEKIRLALRGS
jgi:hypothetical protein